MIYSILFYLVLLLVVLVLGVSWIANLFGLPGNWIMVAVCLIWFLCVSHETRWGIELPFLILFVALAGIGELIEFGASVLGTRKAGGSRKAATYSVVGSIIGGIIGGIFGLPIAIPMVGMVVGSVLFACAGAMIGATLGERSHGSEMKKSVQVGGAAFAGRFVGTVGKIALGSAILVIAVATMLF